MEPLTTTAAVGKRMEGGLPSGDEDRAQAYLEDASALARDAAGETWLTEAGDLTDVPPTVVAIVCKAVIRAIDNYHGRSQESQGPWAQSIGPRAAGSQEAQSGVFLTDAEVTTVRRAAGIPGWSAVEVEHHYGFHDRTGILGGL